MKTVKLLKATLRNFKGASNHPNACKTGQELDLEFGDITVISADNARMKTTVFDAWKWLLWGVNADDKSDFNIKTLKADNTPIHKLEHEVKGLLDIDGMHVPLKKVLREKWTKKRGDSEVLLTGHETEYFIHGVPKKKSEYDEYIASVLPESIAKLICDPLYFNKDVPTKWGWKDRRKTLEDMAGAITNEFIAGSNEDFKALVAKLGSKPLEDQKKIIVAAKKKIKDALDVIPTRMDEVDRGKPQADDYEAIEQEIALKNGEIEGIDKQIEGNVQQHEVELGKIRGKQTELSNLKTRLQQADVLNKSSKATKLTEITGHIGKINGDINNLNGQIRSMESEIRQADSTINLNNTNIQKNQDRINTLTEENEKLVEKWTAENEKELTIDLNSLKCPTCKQDLPENEKASKTETLTANFNKAKATELARIKNEGVQTKATIESLQNNNVTLLAENEQLDANKLTYHEAIEKLRDGITEFNALITDANSLKARVEAEEVLPSTEMVSLQEQINNFVVPAAPVIDNAVLKGQKETYNTAIGLLKEKLATKQQIANAETRLLELAEEERNLSQQLADLEKEEFVIDSFNKAKNNLIESRINHKFKLVTWRMFKENLNGGEEPCCECMVNGVPYSDINTGAKIQAGIDVINALTEHYKIKAPIWVDNRESVTTLPPCQSQVINLVALKGQKLKITTQDTNDLNLVMQDQLVTE